MFLEMAVTRAGVQVVRKTAFHFHLCPDFVLDSPWALPRQESSGLPCLPLLPLDECVQYRGHSQLVWLMDERHVGTWLLTQTRLRKIKEQSWGSWGLTDHGEHLGGG